MADEDEDYPKRWQAIIYYRTDNGIVPSSFDIEELLELHLLVERGPHWDTIDHIEVRRLRPPIEGYLTVEESLSM